MSAPVVLLLLAAATVAGGGHPGRARLRGLTAAAPVDPAPPPRLRPVWVAVGAAAVATVAGATGGPAAAAVSAVLALAGGGLALRRLREPAGRADDAVELAGRWPLLAVCLEAGMPVAAALAATAAPLDGGSGQALRRVAGLLALGADPAQAWATAAGRPELAVFARAASRSAGTGSGLAQVARTEAARLRADLADTAQARAQRAAVLITGPLGLCFLPAFLALGIAPVVIGLAGEALTRW